MKYLLFFSILISSVNAIAIEIKCKESLGTVTCKESRPLFDPNSPGAKMRREAVMGGIEQMGRGIRGLGNQLNGLNGKKGSSNQRMAFTDSYFVKWLISYNDEKLLKHYMDEVNADQPDNNLRDIFMQGLLSEIEYDSTFFGKSLNKKEKESFQRAIKEWSTVWNSFLNKHGYKKYEKRTSSEIKKKLDTNKENSNISSASSFKFVISESDAAALSSKLKTLVPKAKDGNLRAQYALGLSFVKGEGAKENRELGISILEASAEKDHFKSQYALGTIYEKEGNYAKAARWYGRAANLGHLESQFRFGWFFSQGEERGVTKDLTKAKYWFKKAAKSGHLRAQYLLGAINYTNGESLEAYKWLHISEENGLADKYIKTSQNLKNKLAQELTESQIENSKRVALQCIKSNYKSCSY
jgi:TPR repeat protein